ERPEQGRHQRGLSPGGNLLRRSRGSRQLPHRERSIQGNGHLIQEGRTMTGQKVGFVGVGRMGGRMARRLLQAGVPLTIYDTSGAAMKDLQALGAAAVS